MHTPAEKKGWEPQGEVKYRVSPFEEEKFKKYYNNGGREQLSKRGPYLYAEDHKRKKKSYED
jgi:hypothetical protein